MKFTKISSDKAYKLYISGERDNVYFLPSETAQYLKIPQVVNYYGCLTRSWFRARKLFIGEELPKVTVRQKIEVHCTIGPYLRDDVLKIINIEHAGGEDGPFARTEELSNALDKAREHTVKYILFDIDSNGEKSNFRFE